MDHFIILFVCDLEQTCSPTKEKRTCSPTKIQQQGLRERSQICFSAQKQNCRLNCRCFGVGRFPAQDG